jgi:hypothetical protein
MTSANWLVHCTTPPDSVRGARLPFVIPLDTHGYNFAVNNARASPLKEDDYRRSNYENRPRSRSACHNARWLCRRASSIPWTGLWRVRGVGPGAGRRRPAVVLPPLGLLDSTGGGAWRYEFSALRQGTEPSCLVASRRVRAGRQSEAASRLPSSRGLYPREDFALSTEYPVVPKPRCAASRLRTLF